MYWLYNYNKSKNLRLYCNHTLYQPYSYVPSLILKRNFGIYQRKWVGECYKNLDPVHSLVIFIVHYSQHSSTKPKHQNNTSSAWGCAGAESPESKGAIISAIENSLYSVSDHHQEGRRAELFPNFYEFSAKRVLGKMPQLHGEVQMPQDLLFHSWHLEIMKLCHRQNKY